MKRILHPKGKAMTFGVLGLKPSLGQFGLNRLIKP